MIHKIEGNYIARITYTNFNTKTKKISIDYGNAIYKIEKIYEHEFLVEANILSSKKIINLLFFEDSNGFTSASSTNSIDRMFFNDNILIHNWSNQIDSNGIIINGRAELENACVKCN